MSEEVTTLATESDNFPPVVAPGVTVDEQPRRRGRPPREPRTMEPLSVAPAFPAVRDADVDAVDALFRAFDAVLLRVPEVGPGVRNNLAFHRHGFIYLADFFPVNTKGERAVVPNEFAPLHAILTAIKGAAGNKAVFAEGLPAEFAAAGGGEPVFIIDTPCEVIPDSHRHAGGTPQRVSGALGQLLVVHPNTKVRRLS